MDNIREKILESQVDDLAGQVNRLREQMSGVVDILCRYENSELLKVTTPELAKLKVPTSAAAGAFTHAQARDTKRRSSERDAEIDRLIAERRDRAKMKD